MKKQPKIALVLSGGGALGFAHVGVIDILQQHNRACAEREEL
jgi:predicted acylesterase/phospholipase RssA